MRKLPDVTLVLVDCLNYGKAITSLIMSLKEIEPARTIFFTDIEIPNLDPRIELVKIDKITSKEEYSNFVFKKLIKEVNIRTDFVLITQHDGYVLDGEQWKDEFMDYDYIGAPWIYENGRQIGNGGFSLRSRHLMTSLAYWPEFDVTHPEDQSIGIIYRPLLEQKFNIKFPDEELAESFSYELRCPVKPTFGFHGFFHEQYKPTVVIRRKDAMGDVVQVEPILAHFHSKGYRVVLDTLPQFFAMFSQHYFKVHHPDEIDGRLLKTAKVYNLDLSYETNPKQLHLKSYFDFCEVPKTERHYRNPILHLNVPQGPETKFFKKYCVIHVDRRSGGRDIQGNIDWHEIVATLLLDGYTIVQIGRGEHDEIIGTVQMNVPNELMLMWLIRDADLFIGVDSGPSNIAVAFNVPSAIFFGSVAPELIHTYLSNIEVIQFEKVCRTPKCWSSEPGTQGVQCIEDVNHPPCVQYTTDMVLNAIKKLNHG